MQFLVSARAEINAKNYKGPGDSETQPNRKSSHGGKKTTKTEAKRRWTMQRSGSSVPTERWSSKSWSRTCLGHWRDFPSQVASICIQPNQFLKDPTHFNRKCLRNEFNLNSTCLTHFLVRCLVQSVILGCCFLLFFLVAYLISLFSEFATQLQEIARFLWVVLCCEFCWFVFLPLV